MVSKRQWFQAVDDLQLAASHMGNSRYGTPEKAAIANYFFLYISFYDNTFIGGHEHGKKKLLC